MNDENLIPHSKRSKNEARENGKKGGKATAKNHDQEFFEEIGEKGGNARARQRNNNNNNSNNS